MKKIDLVTIAPVLAVLVTSLIFSRSTQERMIVLGAHLVAALFFIVIFRQERTRVCKGFQWRDNCVLVTRKFGATERTFTIPSDAIHSLTVHDKGSYGYLRLRPIKAFFYNFPLRISFRSDRPTDLDKVRTELGRLGIPVHRFSRLDESLPMLAMKRFFVSIALFSFLVAWPFDWVLVRPMRLLELYPGVTLLIVGLVFSMSWLSAAIKLKTDAEEVG